jgi:hypothetical protein
LHSYYGKSSGIGKLNRAAMLLFLFADDAASSITAAGDAIKEPAIAGTLGQVFWRSLLANTLGEELLPRLWGFSGVSCGA